MTQTIYKHTKTQYYVQWTANTSTCQTNRKRNI